MDVVQTISKMSNSLSRRPNYSENPQRIYLRCSNDSRDGLDKVQQKSTDQLNPQYEDRVGATEVATISRVGKVSMTS